MQRLEFQDLKKSFGDVIAVDHLSLEVSSGEILGMIGPDGAGKSTAMRMACALLTPDEGYARIMGHDSVTDPFGVKRHLGYMPQRFSLYPDLSVQENLHFFADLYNVPKSERDEREKRLMQFSRLDPFRKRRASQLSGGMKQKLALSCTLIHSPEVLILDEPTTGVDPVSRQEFWTILRELAGNGHALLVSTPYMDETSLCDRVVLMHRGKTLAVGTPESIPSYFQHRLLEVSGKEIDKARHVLHEHSDGMQVHRFGDRLHIIYNQEDQQRRISDLLRDISVQVKPAEPTIEDTFVSLIGEARSGEEV